MQNVRIILAMLFSTLIFTASPALADDAPQPDPAPPIPPGQTDSSNDPIVVTDPSLVPDDVVPNRIGCVRSYVWDLYTDEGHQYYVYTDTRRCYVHFTRLIVVEDRCGWRRDRVRIEADGRVEFWEKHRLSKTKWRIDAVTRDGYLMNKTYRRIASFWVTSTNKTCWEGN